MILRKDHTSEILLQSMSRKEWDGGGDNEVILSVMFNYPGSGKKSQLKLPPGLVPGLRQHTLASLEDCLEPAACSAGRLAHEKCT